MTKNEFLYDHDYPDIVDLLNRHMELHGLSEKQDKMEKTSDAKTFFI